MRSAPADVQTDEAASAPRRPTVAIVAVGTGNLGSVVNALRHLGAAPTLLDDPTMLDNVDGIILPGVGSFSDGMKRLRSGGWVQPLRTAAMTTPILGICLGMQLLAELGTEGGESEGLALVPGIVRRLTPSAGVRVPHVGWNDVELIGPSGLIDPSPKPPAFYFVHSYALDADNPAATAVCEHGSRFAAVVERGSVFGTQFHPEKSHTAGLTLLTRFLDRCAPPC